MMKLFRVCEKRILILLILWGLSGIFVLLYSSGAFHTKKITLMCPDPFEFSGRRIGDAYVSAGSKSERQLLKEVQTLRKKKFFIAALLYNSEELFPHWGIELMRIVELVGDDGFANIFISIHDSNSNDATPKLVRELKAKLVRMGIPHDVQTSETWKPPPVTKHTDRIKRLAGFRNVALRGLTDSFAAEYDEVIYLNDVFFCATAVLNQLLASHRNDADLTCSVDMVYDKPGQGPRFYDVWVARDPSGKRFVNEFPYTGHNGTKDSWNNGDAFPAFSCWNGIVVMKANLFQKERLSFRAGRAPFECMASECELFARDMWMIGRHKILVEPKSVVTYQKSWFMQLQHAAERHLDATGKTWVDLALQSAKFAVTFQNTTPPRAVDCCSLRHGHSQILWVDCFQEDHWELTYDLLGHPRDQDHRVLAAAQSVITMHDAHQFVMDRIGGCPETTAILDEPRVDGKLIPRQILQIGKTEKIEKLPFFNFRASISWWDQNPCYLYVFLDDDQVMSMLMADDVAPVLARDKFANGGELADYARYLWMHQHGGVYADTDVFALDPIDNALSATDQLVVGWEAFFRNHQSAIDLMYASQRSLSLHLFAVMPHSAAMRALILRVNANIADPSFVYARIYERRHGLPSHLETIMKTGPGAFSDTLLSLPAEDIKILPLTIFTGDIDPARKWFYDLMDPVIMDTTSSDTHTEVAYHANTGSWVNFCFSILGERLRFFDHLPLGWTLTRGHWIASLSSPSAKKPLWIAPYKPVRNSHFYLQIHPFGFQVKTGMGPGATDSSVVYEVMVASPPAEIVGDAVVFLSLQGDANLVLYAVSASECDGPPDQDRKPKYRAKRSAMWSSQSAGAAHDVPMYAAVTSDGRLAIFRGTSPNED